MRSLLFLPLVSALASSPAFAEVESWYAFWGIGFADNSYPSGLQEAVDIADSAPGVSHTQGAIDVLGFYWPLADNKTIIGGVVSGAYDRLDDGDNYFQINQYLYALSTMHFVGKEPGHGFFVRGDVGISKGIIISNFAGNASSDSGYGFLVGTGYGFPVSDDSRLILNINYSQKSIESETYHAMSFSVAGLW